MGMTLYKAILRVVHSQMNVDDKETADFIIDTMRKYQKIEQILKDIPYGGDVTVRRIQEVVEDGNDEAKVND